MRGYLLKICGVFIVSSVCNVILPDGNVKKYAKVLMSIIVCITLLSPGDVSLGKISYDSKEYEVADNFENQLTAEYKNRIENTISEKCGCECEVVLDEERNIKKIILKGECSEEGREYIVTKLCVDEENIVTVAQEQR